MPETKHKGRGHPGNAYHTVEQTGLSMTCYLSGEEVEMLMKSLQSQNTLPTDAKIREQARKWFHAMMENKREEIKQEEGANHAAVPPHP